MRQMQDGMTIGRLAKAAGVNVETIRYYQRRGLLKEPQKPLGGQRRYASSVVQQLGFIRKAQQLGFSLEEVKVLLEISEGRSPRKARSLVEEKYTVLESRMKQLDSMRKELKRLLDASARAPGRVPCPIVAFLLAPE